NALLVLARALANEPTIDGSCGTTSTEYEGSDAATSANLRFLVGRRSTISYVFVCLEVAADTSNDGVSDWGELLFDQGHEGSSTPQDNDRRFRVTSGAGGTFSQDKGDGSAWTLCGGSCDAGNSARGEFNNSVNEVYEFRIRFSDIWGTDSPTDHEQAGFALVAFSGTGSATYTWGADNVNEDDPGTWGHLQISAPEFRDILVPVGFIAFLALLRRRRRQVT
ncbi:MAG: hypothetical protein ACT4OI_02320, partial [Methanobacteriota archaeon]